LRGGGDGVRISGERGGILGKSLILIIIVFALFAVTVIDGGSIFFTSLHLQDVADQAALAAANDFAANHNIQSAEAAAAASVKGQEPGAWVEKGSVKVDSNGAVTLTVDEKASSIVLRHIGPLEKYTIVHVSSTQTPSSG
jgi:uncharacterized membrane protein